MARVRRVRVDEMVADAIVVGGIVVDEIAVAEIVVDGIVIVGPTVETVVEIVERIGVQIVEVAILGWMLCETGLLRVERGPRRVAMR